MRAGQGTRCQEEQVAVFGHCHEGAIRQEGELAARHELSAFLASVERRAFKQAFFALRNEDSALEVVQEAMMRLTASYADRPADEYPMLFQRILQNAIRDVQRRERVRSTWTTLLSAFGGRREEDEEFDPLDVMDVAPTTLELAPPHEQAERSATLRLIEREISRLPPRQREAFLLRYWEELSIAETAEAMGCSEGSVKTHCSRAVHTLAAALRDKGVQT